jgi:hypothetical protein
MAPSAPPLTREEFVSLRDGAKGLMHRIPSEHKARLIELGYIEEVFGGIRLTSAGRMRIAEGWPTWNDQNPTFDARFAGPGISRNPEAARLFKCPQYRNKSRHGWARWE